MLTKSKIRDGMNHVSGRQPVSDWATFECVSARALGRPRSDYGGELIFPTRYSFTISTELAHERFSREGLDFSVREVHNYLYGDIRTQAWEVLNRIKFGTRDEALEAAEKLIEMLEGD